MDYGEQPDRQATSVTPDEIDPSFSQVQFSDGTMETMPTSQAEALPQRPPAPPAVAAPLAGPLPTPEQAQPNALAAAWEGAGHDPLVAATEAGTAQPGYQAPVGRPTNPLPDSPGGVSELPAPQTDLAEIVAPGTPGGFADFSQATNESATSTDTVEDPEVMGQRVDDAFDDQAAAARLHDTMRYSAQRDALDTESDARDAQAAEAQRALRQAQAEKTEHEKIYKAIEATPIDEDAFWSESPGRAAGAWIALALSGFLQGATRGQNPALNQMVQALNHAQDRYVQNQQKSRDSQLRTRERLMGSSENAVSSLKLQLSGIMEKRIMLDAQREGLAPPPGLATYLAQGQVKRAEEKNAIGARVAHSATVSSQAEQRATPGTGPVTRFDAGLRAIGVTPEAHQKAEAAGVGEKVRAADELRQVHGALQKIAAANGGDLKAQGTMSWTQLGLAPLAARLGIKNAEEQVNTTQLLNQASLAYISAIGNIKGLDSNVERERFEKILNSGETQTTLAAIDERARMAENSAVSVASGFAGGNARRYVDLLRGQQQVPESGGFSERVVRPGKGPTETETLDQAAGGAAPGPLAGATRPAARALETSTTGSRPGTYQRLRGSKPGVRP